jgi:hypothetical protein
LVVGDDALKLFHQVEGDVRLPVGDRRAQFGQVVTQAQCTHIVTSLAQVFHHIVLGAELIDLFVAESGEALRWHQGLVHEHHDTQWLHRA